MKFSNDVKTIKFLLHLPFLYILEDESKFDPLGNSNYRTSFKLEYEEIVIVQKFLSTYDQHRIKHKSSELVILENQTKYYGIKFSELYDYTLSVHVIPKEGFPLTSDEMPSSLKEDARSIVKQIISYTKAHHF